MHQRALLGLAVVVPVAGCSAVTDLVDENGIDETLEDERTAEFSADAGDELAIAVDIENVETGDAVSVQIAEIGAGPLDARSVPDSDSYDVTIEASGDHVITVTNGAAHVDVEWI
jgi:hypothetical protein